MPGRYLLTGIFCAFAFGALAQQRDTVIVNLAKTSKIIFTVEDADDLDVLKHYDFDKLFQDIIIKIQEKKGGPRPGEDSVFVAVEVPADSARSIENLPGVEDDPSNDDDATKEYRWQNEHRHDDYDDNDQDIDWRDHRWNRTWQTFNFDLGINNYIKREDLPIDNDMETVRPWGSWYLGLSSVQRSRLAKNFFLEWGLGMSWYNFKFENDNTYLDKDETWITFAGDTRDVDFIKSKLTVSYIQASLIPVIDFGDHGRKPRFWDGYTGNSFRFGLGPYIGYRIGSHTKLVYKEGDGDREKDKQRDGYHLNNLRYGSRLQIGWRSTDLFFNMDFNTLFRDDRGRKLNAFSFGVIF